jgi:hypothetical protein
MQDEAKHAVERTGVEILDLIMVSYARVVISESNKRGRIDTTLYSKIDLDHIVDWLAAARLRNEDWLTRLDSEGRPKKLMKFGSIAQMVAEANKAMRKRRNDGVEFVASDGAELVHECGDGYGVFRLTTSSALDQEGWQMGHCVGQGAYDGGVNDGRIAIFSLRDGFGKSHVTVEVNLLQNNVRQIKGKGNDFPKAEYMARLIPWLDPRWEISNETMPPEYGIDRNGRLVNLARLRAGEVFDGDLNFNSRDAELDEFRLPLADGVIVDGDVVVTGPNHLSRLREGKDGEHGILQRLIIPKGLKVRGTLKARFMCLDVDEIDVGVLATRKCEVRRLPTRLTARECIFSRTTFEGMGAVNFASPVVFRDCLDAALGEGIVFEQDVTVKDSHQNSMSDEPTVSFEVGTHFMSNLLVDWSHAGIGEGVRVDGNLTINISTANLPESLSVGGDFIIFDAILDRWPTSLEVGGKTNAVDYDITWKAERKPDTLKFG